MTPRPAKKPGAFERWRSKANPEATPGAALANTFRAGVETWITGSYDPDLNLTYWGTAQAKPWMRVSRGSGNGATLYANSTVALNADTGKLAWSHSYAPGETLDLDEVFERVLVDDQGQNYVFSAGKAGILWKLGSQDRKISRSQGNGVPERLRFHRLAHRANRTIATISSSSASASG